MEKIKPCSINHTLLFIYECTPGVFLRPGCDGAAVTQCSLPPWSLLLFAGWRKIVNWNSGRGPSGSARDRQVSWNQKAGQLSTGRELAETWNSCSVSADGNRKDVKELKTTTTTPDSWSCSWSSISTLTWVRTLLEPLLDDEGLAGFNGCQEASTSSKAHAAETKAPPSGLNMVTSDSDKPTWRQQAMMVSDLNVYHKNKNILLILSIFCFLVDLWVWWYRSTKNTSDSMKLFLAFFLK